MTEQQPKAQPEQPLSSSADEQTTVTPDDTASVNPESNAQQTQDTKQNSKAKKVLLSIVVLIILALIIFGLWKSYQPKTISVQGRVEADTIHVSTKVPSRIEHIYVEDGQAIKQGQALIKLSSPEVEAKKQQALAALQSALALQSTAERGSQQENIDTLYANWQSITTRKYRYFICQLAKYACPSSTCSKNLSTR